MNRSAVPLWESGPVFNFSRRLTILSTLGIYYAAAGAGVALAASGTHVLRSGSALLKGRLLESGGELGAAAVAPLMLNWRAWGGFAKDGMEFLGQTGRSLRAVGDHILPSGRTAGLQGAAAAAAFAAAGGATVATAEAAAPTVRKIVAASPTVSTVPPSVPPTIDGVQDAMAKLAAAAKGSSAENEVAAEEKARDTQAASAPLGGYFSIDPAISPDAPANASDRLVATGRFAGRLVEMGADLENPDADAKGRLIGEDGPDRTKG